MGSLGGTPPLPPAPVTTDATDEALAARRQARAMSLFGLSSNYTANFSSKTSLGPGQQVAASYGAPIQDLLGGTGQVGDMQGTTLPPDLRPGNPNHLRNNPGNAPIDPNNPNAPGQKPGAGQ
jgi:hypothetical protein